jgi:hypothetical protein
MSYINITVIAYSGYRLHESPRAFLLNDVTLTVVEILDKWIEESYADRIRKRFFVVKTNNDKQFKVYVDEKTSEWFCEIK